MTEQVTDQVTTDDQGLDQAKSALGWRSALSDDLKEHDYVKTFQKPTDFVKAALEIKTEHESLQEKMKGAIFKPGKGATDEELTAYRKAMGIPEDPTEYEFPKGEDVEHDEKMIEWARGVFHNAGLTKEQGALISQSWDAFIEGLIQAQLEQRTEETQTALNALKEEWGPDFKGNMELIKRGWEHFTDEDFDKFCDDTGIGNHPALIKFVFKIGKAMGEDFSPASTPKTGEGELPPGMHYEGMDHFK